MPKRGVWIMIAAFLFVFWMLIAIWSFQGGGAEEKKKKSPFDDFDLKKFHMPDPDEP